jgi:hypothetical protein
MQAMVLERPRDPLKLVERPDPQPSHGEVRSVCRRAASAGQIFTWLMVNCRIRSSPSFPVTKSSDESIYSERALTASRLACESAFPERAVHCEYCREERENLRNEPYSPGIRETAASPPMSWPTRNSYFGFLTMVTTSRPRRYSVPAR